MILLEEEGLPIHHVTLPLILYAGRDLTIRIEFHTLYQIVLVFIDSFSSPVMVLDTLVPLTSLSVIDRTMFVSEATVHADISYQM